MRIDNTNSTAALRKKKSAAKTSSAQGGFSLDSGEETVAAQTAAPLTNVASLDALLALQSVEDSATGKKRAVEQGFDLLDRLEEMQLGLLTGKLSSVQLVRISQKIKNLSRTGDENLDSIISDIDMRARIELAKLGIYDF